jgi:enoyl-CoA hydratase/carnithine racemase
MKWLIALLLGVANGLVWAVILACLFKPQLWMALGPKGAATLCLDQGGPQWCIYTDAARSYTVRHERSTRQFTVAEDSPSFWRVIFNNPPINLLDPDAIRELHQLIATVEATDALKVVVFESANPDYFIAHYDISRAGETPPWADVTMRLAHASVVSIAAVRGRARGVGNEFVLACDLRFASLERAFFCQPEVAVGVVPGGGAVERLPPLLGSARALEILLGSDDLNAATAERYGLLNRAIPDADFDAFVTTFARRIASFDKRALAAVKSLVNRHGLPTRDELVWTSAMFRQSVSWEGAKARIAPLIKAGLSKPGDFELRPGHHLGNLMALAADKADK